MGSMVTSVETSSMFACVALGEDVALLPSLAVMNHKTQVKINSEDEVYATRPVMMLICFLNGWLAIICSLMLIRRTFTHRLRGREKVMPMVAGFSATTMMEP